MIPKPESDEEVPDDREEPLDEKPPVVGSVDEGAEVWKDEVFPTPADDYTANAIQEEGNVGEDDFSDEQDVADRPDTAVMLAEEGDDDIEEV